MYLLKQGLFYIVCEFFVVCNYYTHKNCKMFAMVNCKETSSYVDSAQVCVCVCVVAWYLSNVAAAAVSECISST